MRGMVLTRPARLASRRRLHSQDELNEGRKHHLHREDDHNLHAEEQTDTLDSQEEPLLAEAYSCSTLLTECGGVIDSINNKSTLLNPEVYASL